ncbi:MAG: thioredoxin family protein [Candidatus Paracaedibacteraceae bacterium]|nr:thioredoxin family protein [Candidatus Paracaedibacteraceae bacterium]
MLRILSSLILIFGLNSANAAKDKKIPDINSTIKIGELAPDFDAKDTQGKDVKLKDLKGKFVVLEWTNYECPFVQKHYKSKNMQDLQKKYTDKGVVWISVISSAPGQQGHMTNDTANAAIKDKEATPTHMLLDSDGAMGRAYGAKTTPHMFVIDKDGKLAYMGAIDNQPTALPDKIKSAKNYVSEALDELMADKKVTEHQTQSYGCAVKYAS